MVVLLLPLISKPHNFVLKIGASVQAGQEEWLVWS